MANDQISQNRLRKRGEVGPAWPVMASFAPPRRIKRRVAAVRIPAPRMALLSPTLAGCVPPTSLPLPVCFCRRVARGPADKGRRPSHSAPDQDPSIAWLPSNRQIGEVQRQCVTRPCAPPQR